MNGEKLKYTPEQGDVSPEQLEQAGAERRKELHEQLEKRGEKSQERNIEKAREAALERAKEREPAKHERQPSSPAERRQGPISKKDREASFNTTMQEVRSHMSTPSRAFSKFIHNKAVEKASEVVGSTVARPNAILTGSIFAFVLTLGVYVIAKNLGYPLSGFETIAAFVVGWLLGIVFDFIKIMVTGRK